ncbi:MAG: GNAT family N-acetyltransferase [Acidimicrobiia bacterium]|nr:GNAT family N-acetyltransferase [Acidimicrobiia bacterium]
MTALPSSDGAPDAATASASAAEKQFYLRELRGRTVLIALDGDPRPARPVLTELLIDQVRLIVVTPPSDDRAVLPGLPRLPLDGAGPLRREQLTDLWTQLRTAHAVVVTTGADAVCAVADHLATALRPSKVVLAYDGLTTAGLGSFLHPSGTLPADLSPPVRRRVQQALDIVEQAALTVNLCDIDRVADELFTYEGAGTLLSRHRYLDVAPLAVDQWAEVEALLDDGVHEGYLRARRPEELAAVLFDGFGATITGSGHLAGIVALETERYAPEPVGELVSLVTISRFSRQGVASALIDRVVAEATDRGVRWLFTCTTSAAARELFERSGFVPADADRVPAAKWEGYDPARRDRVIVLGRPLDIVG